MPLDGIPVEAITEADLQALDENRVAEAKTIEYKVALPGNSQSAKTEFLADVSSFANASGGHLIYGMREENGAAAELCGLKDINPDAEKLRLENMIRDGIEPRIPGLSMSAVATGASKQAILIRIPRSWASPHRVSFQGHGHFYSRNSAGKYRLDVPELRAAFALSEGTTERIRNLRVQRLCQIASGETPIPIADVAKIVLHIVPFGAFDPASVFDLSWLITDRTGLQPLYSNAYYHRYNLYGVLGFSKSPPSVAAHSYLQVFRNGTIEAVDACMLEEDRGDRTIPSQLYEKELIDGLSRFLVVQQQLGVVAPVFVMLSLLSVSGYEMAVSPRLDSGRFLHSQSATAYAIDTDTIIVPEIVVERFDCDASEAMRTAFDAVWNAAGWPRSMNDDDEGRWVGQR